MSNMLKNRRPKILLVDDEPRMRLMYKDFLETTYDIDVASSGQEALEKLKNSYFDLVLLDIFMPEMGGLETLKQIKKDFPTTDVIMFTMNSSVETVVQAMTLGAIDYIEKQKPRKLIQLAIQQALEKRMMNQQLSYYTDDRNQAEDIYQKVIGRSEKIKDVLQIIQKLKDKDVSILITGENGTGKELVAELLTQQEKENRRIQYSINCGAISPHLIESELFGHVKGAFTDARADRKGLFELANGNDIFLDEIGELPLELQSKLLRVLQEKEIKPVGSNKTIKVNFRLICATNKNLQRMVQEGKFREDLYFRINVIQIQVPTLRERVEDIALLARYFLNESGNQKKELSEEVLDVFRKYPWPGNIRQLKNVLIHMAIFSGDEKTLTKRHIPKEVLFDHATFTPKLAHTTVCIQNILETIEKKLVKEALEQTDWVIVKAAKLLGTHRNSINNKLKAWNWKRPEAPTPQVH